MDRKRKISACLMIAILALSSLLAACGQKTAPAQESVPILSFQDDESTAKLVSDMEAGKLPAECYVMYDEMGSRPEVQVTDPEMLKEIYKRFSQMTVGAKTDTSVTDSYHYIIFILQDGTEVSWGFEGTGLLSRGQENYEVSDEGGLWEYVRRLQEEIMESWQEDETGQTSGGESSQAQQEETGQEQQGESSQMQKDIIEQDGVTQTAAVYPAAIAADMSAQQFLESDAHWDWWNANREKVKVSEPYRETMNTYYQNMMEKILLSSEDNTVCSPLNTFVAFALLAEVSGGNTRQQILDMLGASDIESLRTQVQALWDSNYVNTPILQSLLANSIWLRESTQYKEETLNLLAQQYHASSFSGDPGSEEMSKALQQWTDQNTGGLLSEYTKSMKLDAATVLAIVSTIYYKAAWVDKFYEKFNTQETFHGKDGDTTVDMMHTSDFTNIYQTDAFTAAGLNLNDSGTMYFFLPQDGVDVNALAGDPDILKATVYDEDDENRISAQVNFAVPKFKISGKTDLIGIIRELGITDALDPGVSDFTPLTEDVDELYLSSANHAAMVEVDENGVTGAAYTELMMTEGAMLPDKEIDFVLDRPFMFVVTGADGAVLFSGIVRNIDE